MKNSIPYVNQYYNMAADWQRNRIDVDNAPESQIKQIQALKARAIEQSGLSESELELIARCRARNNFKEVSAYSRKR